MLLAGLGAAGGTPQCCEVAGASLVPVSLPRPRA